MGEMGSPHMGKRGVGDFTQKKNQISDIWEEWGRHVWGKGVLGILLKKRIKFLTYGRNGVATYGEKGVLGI